MLSYKYRLKPTKDQIEVLEDQLEICRWVWNTHLGWIYDERKAGRGTPLLKLNYNLIIMKEKNPELRTVYSQILQNIAKRIGQGFDLYWSLKRSHKKGSPPKFKGRGDYNSITYPQSGFSLKDGLLKLSKIGSVKIIQHRPIEGEIKTLTIKQEPSGKWYAIFACNVEDKLIEGRLPAVGIDFGLDALVAFDDGMKIEAPQFYRKSYQKLRRIQRIHSKRKKGSKNREKGRMLLTRAYEKGTNQRKDLAFKIARSIVNKYEKIYIEDLKIKNMVKNKHLSKSIYDAGWGILRANLTYMAERSLGVTVAVDPKNTSQECSGCGEIVPKDLSVRIHNCPHCGLILNRDVNAARNILRKGILLEQQESTLVGEPASTITQRSGMQAGSMNQEATLLIRW
jgi:putative transposase